MSRKKELDLELLKTLYLDRGLSISKCAAFFKTSNPTIRKNLESLGISTRKNPQKKNYEFCVEEAISLHKQGKTLKEIADYFNGPLERIRKDMIAAGYEFKTSLDIPDRDTLNDLYEYKNLNMSDIAKKYNTSVPTVRRWLRVRKIDQKSHSEITTETFLRNKDHPFSSDEVRERALKVLYENGGFQKTERKSKEEEEVREYLNSLKSENDFKTILYKGFELDGIYNNIAFEYCGNYYHCEKFKVDRKYHWRKYYECKKDGIRLITIFSDEWLRRKYQVKGFLKSIAGNPDIILYARNLNCYVGENLYGVIPFIEENHIQGKPRSREIISCLYDENENIFSAMIFGKHHQKGEYKDTIVLNRLSIKSGYHIPGGASRMFKNSCEELKKRGYKYIITWSDNRWTEGNVYEKLGFKLHRENKPDYAYINPKKK